MSLQSGDSKAQVVRSSWYKGLTEYEKPDINRSVLQIANTLIPYFALWTLMVWIVNHHLSLWYLCPLVVLAAGFLVRVFIIFHDCGHGSFFTSHKLNRIVGNLCGILVFTPYDEWRHMHAAHHATTGDLDRRGMGDITTMTVKEYLAAPPMKRFGYRLFRHPFVLFIIGPLFQFLIFHRFSHKGVGKRERSSVIFTNMALLAILLLSNFTIGLYTYLVIQLPVIMVAAAIGVWLFYVQHQYEGVYWEHHEEWDPVRAALKGSSYFRLPKILAWFSGDIGLHHIHHLRPRIPNYYLQQCYDNVPALQVEEPLTIAESFKCLRLNLWDEDNQKLISFRTLRAYRHQVEKSY